MTLILLGKIKNLIGATPIIGATIYENDCNNLYIELILTFLNWLNPGGYRELF